MSDSARVKLSTVTGTVLAAGAPVCACALPIAAKIKAKAQQLRFIFICDLRNVQFVFCNGGAVHLPLSASGLGQYKRITTKNGPPGAGSQLASLSAPGESCWT